MAARLRAFSKGFLFLAADMADLARSALATHQHLHRFRHQVYSLVSPLGLTSFVGLIFGTAEVVIDLVF